MIAELLLLVAQAVNPACTGAGAGYNLMPQSAARNAGVWIEGLHCPQPGYNASGCVQWFESAPDIGACEFIPDNTPPAAPSGLTVTPPGQGAVAMR